ncbi:hypothetical protein V6N11_004435 [Hibiscus sabdariffa]|uniref:Homeobox domain-containing protein n=1 Tax=Hibiscus sabdariffa TaxID=183260 RepID=A0ABR2SGY5_9ROSI
MVDDGAESSDEDVSGGEEVGLKDNLLRRFGNHIGNLKMEFSNKKKKGKLPIEATQTLTQWWNVHNKWPYPTEGDKIALAEATGLDQKQINNWFINQRKRHWKPSESVMKERSSTMDPEVRADQGPLSQEIIEPRRSARVKKPHKL